MSQPSRFVKPKTDSGEEPTRHIYVSGIGHHFSTPKTTIKALFEEFGPLEAGDRAIEYSDGRKYCFVSFQSIESAMNAQLAYNESASLPTELPGLQGRKIHIRFAQEYSSPDTLPRKTTPPEAECTTTTEDVCIPGLYLFEDFISEEEENM
jgi:RNA recognition motif-containing protein